MTWYGLAFLAIFLVAIVGLLVWFATLVRLALVLKRRENRNQHLWRDEA